MIDFQQFVLINIKALAVINIIIVVLIFAFAARDYFIKAAKAKNEEKLKSILEDYLKGIKAILPADFTKDNLSRQITIDNIIKYSEENDTDLSLMMKDLNLDKYLINRLEKSTSLKYLKDLAFTKSASAYEVFLLNTDSSDLEIKYTSYFGLTMLELEWDKQKLIVKKLIKSSILADRIIELLARMDIKFIDMLELLENEDSDSGKVIYLKALMKYPEIRNVDYSDRLLKFLDDTKEVKISAIAAICKGGRDAHLKKLFEVYERELEWEIRAALAKGMVNFSLDLTKDMLVKMVHDAEWWVRFNAAKVLSLMGEEGIYVLIDLSAYSENESISALAYYFLNSNKNIYETVKSIEV